MSSVSTGNWPGRLPGRSTTTSQLFDCSSRRALNRTSVRRRRGWRRLRTCRYGERRPGDPGIRPVGRGAGEVTFPWWKAVPLVVEEQRPQPTATEADHRGARRKALTNRDSAIVELLWSCRLRRGELVRLDVEDVNLSDGLLAVRQSKTGRPRVVPLSRSARRAVRRQIAGRTLGSLLGMTSNAIRLLLKRLGASSVHAWRRGWGG